jgi:DNA-binding NarL/FixJ family response regulator
MTTHTVVLAGAPRLFQTALARVLDADPELEVVALVDDPSAAQAACERLRPTVLVVDAARSGRVAIRVCASIKSCGVPTKVLLTSETEDPELLVDGIHAGIDGFATREDSFTDVLDATRTVARGEARVPPRMLGVLLRSLIERRRDEALVLQRVATLTNREREVMSLMVSGMKPEAIARELVISRETARTHVQRILSKLGVHSQLEAAALVAGCDISSSFSTVGAAS